MSFSEIFKRYGLKMYLSVLLGNFAIASAITIIYFVIAIPMFFLVGIVFAAALEGLMDPFSLEGFDSVLSSGAIGGVIIVGIIIFVLFMLISSLATSFQQAGLISVTIEPLLEGRINISTYFVQGFKKMWKMFLLNLLTLVLPSIPITILILLTIFSFSMGAFGVFIGIVLGLATFLLMALCYLLFFHAPIILIAENAEVMESIKVSMQLFKKEFGRVFGSSFFYFGIYHLLYQIGSFLLIILISFMIGGILATSIDDFFLGTSTTFDIVYYLYFFLIDWWAAPFFLTIANLLITIRYYKYLRPTLGLNPLQAKEGSSYQPYFGLKNSNSQQALYNSDLKNEESSSNTQDEDDHNINHPNENSSDVTNRATTSQNDHEPSWGFKDESSTSQSDSSSSDNKKLSFNNDSSSDSHSSSNDSESSWDFKSNSYSSDYRSSSSSYNSEPSSSSGHDSGSSSNGSDSSSD